MYSDNLLVFSLLEYNLGGCEHDIHVQLIESNSSYNISFMQYIRPDLKILIPFLKCTVRM